MKKIAFLVALMPICSALFAQDLKRNADAENYIDTYKYFAIGEMHRSSIPASITLAQGILESAVGKSPLSQYANNHFGIKCQTTWQGDTYYQNDDAENECFRKYGSVAESFIDHSEFLRTRTRYSALFQLNATDYEAWAFGLKQAGYATNPQYAEILIRNIKLYDLDKYDLVTPKKLQAMRDETQENFDYDDRTMAFQAQKNANVLSGAHVVNYFSGIKTIIFRQSDNLAAIAQEFGMGQKRLERYNEYDNTQRFVAGDRVFLQPKKKRLAVYFHKVKVDETIWDISQKYGLRAKRIYSLNKLPQNAEVATGEMINLRESRASTPKLRTRDEVVFAKRTAELAKEEIIPTKEPLIDKSPKASNTAPADSTKQAPTKTVVVAAPPAPTKQPEPTKPAPPAPPKATPVTVVPPTPTTATPAPAAARTHTVIKGDTMYNITKRYGITIDQLKQYNNLPDNSVKLGQVLKVKP